MSRHRQGEIASPRLPSARRRRDRYALEVAPNGPTRSFESKLIESAKVAGVEPRVYLGEATR
jgi:hypothetical protein